MAGGGAVGGKKEGAVLSECYGYCNTTHLAQSIRILNLRCINIKPLLIKLAKTERYDLFLVSFKTAFPQNDLPECFSYGGV